MIRPAMQDDAFLADVAAMRDVASEALHLWWLGQSGFLLQFRGRHLLFDPYLSDSLTRKYAGTHKPHVRVTERVVAPERLTFVDAVTSTHNHTDHLDPETLRPLAAAAPFTMYHPEANTSVVLDRIGNDDPLPTVGMVAGESVTWGESRITAVPAAHPTREQDERGRDKYLGFVLRPGPFCVYHSGDTVVYDRMAETLRPHDVDLAILPINGKVGNMGGRDAARLAKEIGAKLVVPCHYEMFEFNTADPGDEFVPECERLGQPYKVLRAGERLTLRPGESSR
ncbi:MAG TPA: MBL fold metallo-hydrolase [Tepidisphaeraceae bacterium]|nr:MBL fold metallo-hydrolase [Tepidisphaeraceae bacterium]